MAEFTAQKNHLFLWYSFFFAVGIAVYFGLKSEPSIFLPVFTLACGVICTIFLWSYRNKSTFSRYGYYILIMLSFVVCGFCTAQFKTHLSYTPMITKKISPTRVEGVVKMVEPLGEGEGSRVILEDLTIEKLKPYETPRKIRLKVRKDEKIKPGMRISVLAGLNIASGPVAPGAFDFQRMVYFQGLGAVGFAFYEPEIISHDGEGGTILQSLRRGISDKIQKYTDHPYQPVIIALMTGQRGAIAQRDWDALRGSGLAHLLAISGMHVGMVAGVIFFFSRAFLALFPVLTIKYPIKKWAAALALIAAAFYTLIVGGTVPTQRALLMTGIVMLAIMMDRSPFSLRLVAVAGLIVLLFSPESLISVSFQMSFAAVVALICFYEWIRPWWRVMHQSIGWWRKAILYITGVMLTTVVAGLATGLFSLFHFQNFALYGVLANIIAVPIMSFIVMPFIVLSYISMLLGVELITLPIVEWAVGWILASAHWVAGMEGAVLHVPVWPHWVFILMVVSLWFFAVWQGGLSRVAIPVFMVLVLFAGLHKGPDMLLSSNASLMAVRGDQEHIWLSNGRTDRYVAENWLRLNGQAGDKKKRLWPKEGQAKGFPLSCDSIGCRGVVEGYQLSVAHSPAAALEDCQWADILISSAPVNKRGCQAPHVIDRFDLWREGAHAIWFKNNGINIKTVEKTRGIRPWTQTAASR